MLTLMHGYPEQKMEIIKLAERYFVELDGDWYMTAMFKDWLVKNEIEIPIWFKNE